MSSPPSLTTPYPTQTAAGRFIGRVFAVSFAAGLALFLVCGGLRSTRPQLIQYAAGVGALLVGFVPQVNGPLAKLLDRIRQPSPKARRLATIAIWLFSSWYFLDTATRQDRVMIPKYHDEQMYATQAQFVAHGRLWLPQHPLAEFFETFHVLVRPVYAPIYFPGTAMVFAPAIWLGVPLAFWAALISGAIVALSYRLFTELFDGVGGVLAATMAIALPSLHFVSVMIMSHSVALFLALSMCWVWLRWRRYQQRGWAVLLGVAAGWGAITRPFDVLCFAVPIAVAMSLDVYQRQPRSRVFRHWLGTVAAVLVGAIPLLAVQGLLDFGTTGHVLRTPATAYAQSYWPTAGMGFRPAHPQFHPPTSLVQFQEYYAQRLVPEINLHARDGFWKTISTRVAYAALTGGSTSVILLLIVPTGLLGLRRRRWVVVAALPIFGVSYAFYPFVLYHYALAVAPAMTALVLAGVTVVRASFPTAATALTLAVAAVCLASLHEVNPAMHDSDFSAPFLQDIYRKLAGVKERAVVLFRYTGGGDFDEEPVYNTDSAWIDDAPIIHAHDLGPANPKLFAYYAKLDPQRAIYQYDRATLALERLGTAAELAERFHLKPRD